MTFFCVGLAHIFFYVFWTKIIKSSPLKII
nr:MAG TPA: hypothetical protein [Caudoviricetes sp.]